MALMVKAIHSEMLSSKISTFILPPQFLMIFFSSVELLTSGLKKTSGKNCPILLVLK